MAAVSISKDNLIFALCCALLLVGAICFFEFRQPPAPPALPLEQLAKVEGEGTPPRREREFKIGLKLPQSGLLSSQEDLEELQIRVFEALQAGLYSTDWKAPERVGAPYYIARDPMVFIARDLYLDTKDDLALNHAISYRMRHRATSLAKLQSHEQEPMNRNHYPYRCEIQTKSDRTELGGGWSQVTESRFEYRIQSQPFSETNPPPPAPWHPQVYLPVMQTGYYRDMPTVTATELARFLRSKKVEADPAFFVRLALITQRMRMHLDIKTPYGSGPNPEQAFIVSIDRTEVFEGADYMAYLARNWHQKSPRPASIGLFYEIEIEFERNVSTNIDRIIEEDGSEDLIKTRAAFWSDQTHIRDLAIQSLERVNVTCDARSLSKYLQARQNYSPRPAR